MAYENVTAPKREMIAITPTAPGSLAAEMLAPGTTIDTGS